MDDRSGRAQAEPRQRWRIVFARDGLALDLTPADAVTRWEAAVVGSGLPVASSQGRTTRPRLSFAAPLPAGVPAGGELADLVLTERLTRADLWDRLVGCLPDGYGLIDLYDVWLGAPSLPARLAAADYRARVRPATVAGWGEASGDLADRCARACEALLSSPTLPRTRVRGEGRAVDYDLRPLILALSVDRSNVSSVSSGTGALDLSMRLRIGSEVGSGRPDEVVLAVAERAGLELTLEGTVRERLLTVDDLDAGAMPDRRPPALAG